MEILEHNLQHVNHKFQVAVPFRHISINLPDNYEQVQAQLLSHKCHLLRHPNLILKYQEKIKRLKSQGNIKKVNLDENYITYKILAIFQRCKQNSTWSMMDP